MTEPRLNISLPYLCISRITRILSMFQWNTIAALVSLSWYLFWADVKAHYFDARQLQGIWYKAQPIMDIPGC